MQDIASSIWNILSGSPVSPYSKLSAEIWLSRGELWLVIFALVIGGALVGENRAEKKEKSWVPAHPGWDWKVIFAWLVAAGVIGELFCDADIWVTSGVLQAISDREIAELNRTTSCIEQAAAWRSLRDDQFQKLHDELGKLPPHRPIQLTYIMFDPESMSFAGQFEYLFAHVPWDVDVRAIAYPGAAPFGIFIPDGDGNEDIKSVQRAFANANIDFSNKDTPPENNTMRAGVVPVPPFKVKILVGSKMPPFISGTCDITSMTNATPAMPPMRR